MQPGFSVRPFFEAFGFSNTQLGDVFAVYGITAMLAYFSGGVIADHYSPSTLMTLSLFATAFRQLPDVVCGAGGVSVKSLVYLNRRQSVNGF